MKYKKTVAAITVASMLITMASCSSENKQKTIDEAPTTDKTTESVEETSEESTKDSEMIDESEEPEEVLVGSIVERIEPVLISHNYIRMDDINNVLTIDDNEEGKNNLSTGMYAISADYEDPYCGINGIYFYSIRQLEDNNQLRIAVITFDNEEDAKTAYEKRVQKYYNRFDSLAPIEVVIGEDQKDDYHQWTSTCYDSVEQENIIFHGAFECFVEGNSVFEYMYIAVTESGDINDVAYEVSAAVGHINPLELAN